MSQFWSELKRRNVLRTAGIYLVAGWVILQVLDTVGDFLNMPMWVGRVTIILMLLFFPAAIYLSWAYKISDGSIQRQHHTDEAKPIGKTDYIIIFGLLLLLGSGTYQVFTQQDRFSSETEPVAAAGQTASAPGQTEGLQVAENSIAVLPFVNMSSDPEQEYFSDGITEEILNVLARMPGLQVTSRTSAFSFKNSKFSLPEIAKQLGVAYILEGSVRKSTDNVRITAQLIKVGSDSHLFSESWDRDLADVFAVQDEISGIIGKILQLKLVDAASKTNTVPEPGQLPANVLDDYLHATQLMAATNYSNADLAEELLANIIKIAPGFSQARSRLANVYLSKLQIGQKILPAEAISKASLLAEEALALEPTNAEAMNILSYTYRSRGDIENSDRMLNQALRLEPGNAAILRQAISNSAYEHDLTNVDELAERLLRVDPRSEQTLLVLQDYYRRSENMDEAIGMMERMKELDNTALMYLTLMDVNDYHRGGPEESLEYTRKAYELEPRFAESGARLVKALLDTGAVDEAGGLLETSPGFREFEFPRLWAEMIYRLYANDKTSAYSLAFGLSGKDEQDRYASKAIALRISLLQTLQLNEGFPLLIKRYLAAFPELDMSVVPNNGPVPPILVKYGHFMVANDLALLYSLSGDETRSDKLNKSIERALQHWPRLSVLGFGIADVELLARTGNVAAALNALSRAVDEGWHHLWWFHLDHNPHLDSLRDEPGYLAIRAGFKRFEHRQ